jgi:CRP-like cAMP-binding protein
VLQPAQTVSILQKQPEPKFFGAGQVLFKEGQMGDFMYGLLEGEVDLRINSKAVETVKSGEVFGVGALVGVEKRTYTAVAKTDCKVAFLDQRRFFFAVQETPMFALEVMKSYSERMSRLMTLV